LGIKAHHNISKSFEIKNTLENMLKKNGLFKASPTTNVKLPSTRKDRWSVVVYPITLEDYYSLKKCTFSKSPKRPREEIWENVTTIVLDFLLVNHND
jgi:hypothetical protein